MPELTLKVALADQKYRPVLTAWSRRIFMDENLEFILDVRANKRPLELYERYIANDSPRQMIRAAVEALRGGGHLILFPEGTRTEADAPGRINPFRPGITLIALRAAAPIQTVVIETDSPYLGKGWPIWRLPPVPIRFRLRLGERFEPEADHEALLGRLEDYFRKELAA